MNIKPNYQIMKVTITQSIPSTGGEVEYHSPECAIVEICTEGAFCASLQQLDEEDLFYIW